LWPAELQHQVLVGRQFKFNDFVLDSQSAAQKRTGGNRYLLTAATADRRHG
jgi:hypothetical protein